MATLFGKTLSQVHPKLRTNGIGIATNHRRISLGFDLVSRDKKNPLLRKYLRKRRHRGLRRGLHPDEQGSYHTLDEDFGSSVREPSVYDDLDEVLEDIDEYDEDGEPLSRTVSLPSRVSEPSNVSQQNLDWLLEEHERRFSSSQNSENDEDEDLENGTSEQADVIAYDDFMHRVRQQLQQDFHDRAYAGGAGGSGAGGPNRRRGSLISVTSRGSVPQVFQDVGSMKEEDLSHAKVTANSELKVLASYSIPLIFTFLLEQMFPVVCSLTVGHLGRTELAAVSLASMTTNITYAIFEGIATSLDTLCPLAYGSGNYYSVGVHMQRCIMFSFTVFIPFGFIWWWSETLLTLVMPHEPELIHMTAKFLRVSILGAPAYIIFESLKRFLQAQGIFDAGIYVLMICAPWNMFVSYTLVWNERIGMGFIGAPIAVVLNFWTMVTLLSLYAIYVDGYKCWGGFNSKSLKHWKALSELAVPGIVMLEAEDLSYEILTLFSSYFGTPYLAAQSAVSTTAALLYMIPFSVGISSSTRIGNFIGCRRPNCAKLSAELGIGSSLFVGLLNCLIINVDKRSIANIYTKDEEVIQLMCQLLPLVGIVEIFDSLNAISGSCLRGLGLQYIGSIVNLVVYHLVAIPLGIFLAWYMDMKLNGLWIGIGVGMLIIGLVQSYYVIFADWNDVMERAEKRRDHDRDADSDTDSLESVSSVEAYSDSESDSESSPLLLR
ncbi:uncharacterized protein KLLA0_A06952g [Kluyveromyces lactis]|uniref:KLLA0A06952p n=1 Tax=Kluyveromyces lactis (strain ATCC 8585 / CBS 2359 / DSM 70799 / NBRC 1267 / NRRL Y-1140 / WM37) TaxID=284590 RepID=Q6CXN1_KLULA|nr:uncharacterized protein KLLA0_A06952g [Kluyveromyces lactis]CAH02896.1 KLLA0A06952p [Kluyveromyces lactis]|eukprot:XP_451308.1 uncharacterized protein KLLA0_A06952g [Kluyveromyces lactis]